MNTPNRRDVRRRLESLANHEPPSDLLQRLDADVPHVLPATRGSEDLADLVVARRRRSLLVATLGLAAALAFGFAVVIFLGRIAGPKGDVGEAGHGPTPGAVQATATPETAPTAVVGAHGAAATTATRQVTRPMPARSAVAMVPTVPATPAPLRYGELEGRITDGGGPLPGVTVSASGRAIQGVRSAVSDADGRYTVGTLPAGDYSVRFELQGFRTLETPVKVAAEARRVDAKMETREFAEAITITAEKPVMTLASSAANSAEVLRSDRSVAALSKAEPPSNAGSGYFLNGIDVRSAGELLVVEARDKDESRQVGEAETPYAVLQAQKSDGTVVGEFPLRHTDVKADIAGFMARTVVTQEYVNSFKEPIEAVYVFPLGATAAVNDFVMEVGRRRIVGVVRPREEAERIYRDARERGQTASLLTQERPNIFTQNVANIAPGASVNITITTFETLSHERGTFEYVFSMVVGPRYIPGDALPTAPRATGGGGWSPATTAVPDADRITPHVLKPGERSGHDVGLTVHLDAGLPIGDVRSLAHAVEIKSDGPTRRTIRLTEADAIPNRDFVLRWTVGGEGMQAGAVTYRDGHDGFVALLVQPPLAPADSLVSPREITFVLDISGSMSGIPIETSKSLVRRVLDGLRPSDAFNIFVFAGGNGQLWDEAQPTSPERVAEAKRFLEDLRGSGGTEMLAGLRRAVFGRHDPSRLQMYVFCTDGYVGDEDRILAFVKQERGAARFFAFGIGSSVNRFLIDGIGTFGSGASMVVLPRDAGTAENAASRFFGLIDAPVLVDAAIDWSGLPVVDVYPRRLGDLFTGGAFTVVARYTGRASGTAYLTGRLGTREVRVPIHVELPRRAREHPELGPVWARHRLAELSGDLLTATDQRAAELRKAITDTALEFRLASQFTSFVAVDESELRGKGNPRRIDQPIPMPDGVRYEGVFGPVRRP